MCDLELAMNQSSPCIKTGGGGGKLRKGPVTVILTGVYCPRNMHACLDHRFVDPDGSTSWQGSSQRSCGSALTLGPPATFPLLHQHSLQFLSWLLPWSLLKWFQSVEGFHTPVLPFEQIFPLTDDGIWFGLSSMYCHAPSQSAGQE